MNDADRGPATAGTASGSIDPDVDRHDRDQRREPRRHGGQVVTVTAVGGMIGAAARHGVSLALPTADGVLPWSTPIVNATGCLLIGVLMVLIVETRAGHRLIRPFVGVGVLGGYTTFSTYAVDVQALIADGQSALALGYLTGTVTAALIAVQLGVVLTRAAARVKTRLTRRTSHGGNP